MKKVVVFLVCLFVLLGLGACKSKEASAQGTTLMIYMVGSDLEAKGGAATNDMKEMLESQIDLSCNNVLVYAGGTKKWHNDTVSADTGHTILRLTADGFQTLETRTEASMGDTETLRYFLNYGYNNYPAENFAMILWNHGNGPLIGYGKDMLHENDSLTLLEMQQALADSPFSGDNKLAWVGFDACLMSSVELACIWQEYAHYLIASQEVEPSFGWNYSFLKSLGKADTETLATEITGLYMDSCLEYYERRDFDQRDTTLALLDLSALPPLKTALESLFEKAGEDVQSQYSELVATRVNTRALGRASTGSEYDLIDLVDLAEKMKDRYPAEADAVLTAAKDLVVHNETNAEGCSGLSIYYPFYNKSYYEKTWGEVYRKLDVLPSYTSYLENYAQKWLQNDLLQTVASSVKPEPKSGSEFVLPLTEQQAKNFADANYYILQREGEQIYTRIYTSSNVVKEGNQLVANFDGDILYAKNKFDKYWIPAVDEHDTVGDYTRYSTYVNLTNDLPIFGQEMEGYQLQVEGHRFHISVNNATKEIKTSALVPYATEVQTNTLVGGKQEDADLSQWSQYFFLQERHLYLKRDENNTILPLAEWDKSDYHSANVSRVDDGVEFLFAPIPDGEYYLLFEIEDVQGNRYCSELLPIQSEGAVFPEGYYDAPAEVTWESGDKVELFSQEGITAYLTTVEKYEAVRYALQIENKNDFDVAVLSHELMYNETIYCPDGFVGYFLVPAGKTVTDDGFDFGDAEDLGMLTDMRSVQFCFSVVTARGNRTLIHEKDVSVDLTEATAALRKDPSADSWFSDSEYYKVDAPAYGLLAKEQVLFDHDGVRGTLLGLGGSGNNDRIVLNFCFQNTSSSSKTIAIKGLSFDDMFFNWSTGPITIEPGTLVYNIYVLRADDLESRQITSASSVKLWVSHMQFATLVGGGGFSEVGSYEIALAQQGSKAEVPRGETLLYQDSEVQIYLQKAEKNDYDQYVWTCTMHNIGKRGLSLEGAEYTINGVPVDMESLGSPILGPHAEICPVGQSTVFEVEYIGDDIGKMEIKFLPQFYDMAAENLLYTGTEIVLKK